MRHMIFDVSDLKVAHGALIIVIVRDLLLIISFEVPKIDVVCSEWF